MGWQICGSCWTTELLIVRRQKLCHGPTVALGKKCVLATRIDTLPDGHSVEKFLPQGTVLKFFPTGQIQRQMVYRNNAPLALGVQQQLAVGAVIQKKRLSGHAAAKVASQQGKHPVFGLDFAA